MPKVIKTDRRKYPRVNQRLPLKIAANGYGFTTTTQNISCVGTYCHIERYIPPFTKVLLKIDLPMRQNRKDNNCNLECKGVIVRTEDDSNSGFNIAIFFNEIKEAQRKKISQYVSQLLPSDFSPRR